MIEINSTTDQECIHIVLRGELTGATAIQLDLALGDRLAGGQPPRWLLDLGALTYTSSAGLRVFLTYAKKVKAAGGRLVFCSLLPAVAEVFEISGFTQILTIAPDAAAARRLLLSA